jgi:hypothetical protein
LQDKHYDLYRDADNAANLAGLRQSPAGRIHLSRRHFLQIIVSHHPRYDAANEAADDAKYPKHKDDNAPMGLERLLGWRLGRCWFCGGFSFFFHENLLLNKYKVRHCLRNIAESRQEGNPEFENCLQKTGKKLSPAQPEDQMVEIYEKCHREGILTCL